MSDSTTADAAYDGADGSGGADPSSDEAIGAELDADMAEALDADSDPDDDRIVEHPQLDEGLGT